jgi:hypothetical protein
MKRNRARRRRLHVARMAERAAVPERPWMGVGPRYLFDRGVMAACAPPLRAIAAALRDERSLVDDATLDAVRRFLTRAESPLHGRDATAARREAVRLQHAIVGPIAITTEHSSPRRPAGAPHEATR